MPAVKTSTFSEYMIESVQKTRGQGIYSFLVSSLSATSVPEGSSPAWLEPQQPQTDKSQDPRQVVLVQGLVLLGWGGSPQASSGQNTHIPSCISFSGPLISPPLLIPPPAAPDFWESAWSSSGCQECRGV